MPKFYTPPGSPTFIPFPATLPLAGELVSATALSADYWEPVLDSLEFLRLDLVEDKGVMSALQTKLGVPVIDSSDVALPTYSSPFLLVGALSHHTALETLDGGVKANSDALVNVDANVGGSVTGAAPPVYASVKTIISDSDSHHTAIEKIETYADATRTLAVTATSDASTALTAATNTAAKVGPGAELAPAFTYTSTELIVNGEDLKAIVEKFDAYVQGNRVQTDREFSITVKDIAAPWALAAEFTFYETFIDTSKADASTTATLNTQLREASGDGLEYVAVIPITTTPPHSEVALVWETTGTVTFEANLIGSLTPIDFDTVPSELTYIIPASGAGATLVVKATLSGASSRIHRLAAFTKT